MTELGVGSFRMAIPYRRELTTFLDEFVARHRGVRVGKMFGLPALYAGRRLFACLIEEGVIVRLPDAVARQQVKAGGKPFAQRQRSGKPMGSWILYEPRTAVAARRLTPVLELAAQHVARRQAEELTGVKLA
jgi:TfoX/Sxy family transcriptional regulator of competence genes